jgi:hypothetical protein
MRRLWILGEKETCTTHRLQPLFAANPILARLRLVQVSYFSSPPPPVSDFLLFPLVFTSSVLFCFSHLDGSYLSNKKMVTKFL